MDDATGRLGERVMEMARERDDTIALLRRIAVAVLLRKGHCPLCGEVAWFMPNDCECCARMDSVLSAEDVGKCLAGVNPLEADTGCGEDPPSPAQGRGEGEADG